MIVRHRKGPDEIAADERRRIEARVRLVLGTAASRVKTVDLGLGRDGARDGTEAARCRIRLGLEDGHAVAIDERGPRLEEAVEAALWRLSHRVRLL